MFKMFDIQNRTLKRSSKNTSLNTLLLKKYNSKSISQKVCLFFLYCLYKIIYMSDTITSNASSNGMSNPPIFNVNEADMAMK